MSKRESNNTTGFQIRSLAIPVFVPSLLFSTGEASLIPILPSAAQRLGADLPTAGFIAGLTVMGMVFFDIPSSRIVNRLGERRAMILAAVIASLCITGALFATSIWMLGISVFAAGSMASIFALARHAFLTEFVPFTHRARSLSILGGMFRGGAFLGPMVGAGVVFAFGEHWVYTVGILFCLAAASVLLMVPAGSIQDTPTDTHSSPWRIFAQERGKLSTVGLTSTILAMLRTVRQIGLPLWGLYIGMHPGTVSLFIGIAGALDVALFYVSGQIMDRFGRRWAVVPCLVGMAVTHVALIFAHTPTWFLVVAIAMSLANATGSGVVLTLGADMAPEGQRNEFLAAYRLLVDAGVAVTPVVLSSLTVAITLSGAIGVMAGISLVGAGMGWRYLPKFGIR